MTTKKRKVLEENEYVEKLSEIIVNDFFPELPRLKKQLEILESEGTPARTWNSNTPSTEIARLNKIIEYEEKKKDDDNNNYNNEKSDKNKKKKVKLSLDQFHASHASEDNESFEVVLKQKQIETEIKYKWLYDQEKSEQQFLLTNSENDSNKQQLLIDNKSHNRDMNKKGTGADADDDERKDAKKSENIQVIDNNNDEENRRSLITWQYKAKNELMYTPSDKPFTEEELKNRYSGPPKEIIHENTRLPDDPIFLKPNSLSLRNKSNQTTTATISSSSSDNTVFKSRGIDTSKKILLSDLHDQLTEHNAFLSSFDHHVNDQSNNNNNNNNEYLSTPKIDPNNNNPVMTWGTISTPLLLSTDHNNNDSMHSYKMPATPIREKVALQLTEKSIQKSRIKKANAKRVAAESSISRLSSPSLSPSFSQSSFSSSPSLSPAFKSIQSPKVNNRLMGSFDAQLSKSYRSPAASPKISSSPSPRLANKSIPTPSRSPSIKSNDYLSSKPVPPPSSSSSNSSVFDGLLKL